MYRDDHFEWDEGKEARNLAKHGLNFRDVLGAFDDPDAVDVEDERHAEERWILIALVPLTNLVVSIVYTERGERDRIISARVATREEAHTYYARKG